MASPETNGGERAGTPDASSLVREHKTRHPLFRVIDPSCQPRAFGRMVMQVSGHVAVDVESDTDVHVSEPFLNDLRVHPCAERHRGPAVGLLTQTPR